MNTKVLSLALLDAVIANNAARTRSLLEQGADPNFSEDQAHLTPLHFAAFYNAASVVSLLLVAGADVSLKDRESDTPLDIAKRFGHHEIVTLLERFGTMPMRPAHVSVYVEEPVGGD